MSNSDFFRPLPPGGARRAPPPPGAGAAGPPRRRPPPMRDLPGVAAIVAVASGKGGVGKSTTAVNLALGLKVEGRRVGVLDADIYGPSLPRMLGTAGRKPDVADKVLLPIEAHGLATMSMGYLAGENQATIWRGPMVTGALQQFLRSVRWGHLDILIVDFPPGTGDAHLTMAQSVPIAGTVIVSTPQDIALIDARKGMRMFQKVGVPVLGIVENMSYYLCPHCGDRSEVFGHGGARREAAASATPFLGEIPLDARIRETSDSGTPIVAADPASPLAAVYRGIADTVARRLDEVRARPRPSIPAD